MGVAVGEPQHEQEVLFGHRQLWTLTPGEEPRQEAENLVDWSQDQIEDIENRRDPARNRLGMALGKGLGGDLAEDQDAEGHEADNHRQATVFGVAVGDLCREGRGEHVDQVVADEDGDQEVLRCRCPAIEASARQLAAAGAQGLESGDRERVTARFRKRRRSRSRPDRG